MLCLFLDMWCAACMHTYIKHAQLYTCKPLRFKDAYKPHPTGSECAHTTPHTKTPEL